MFVFLLVLIFLACGLLVLVVLAQNPKGGGLSSAFGGSGAAQQFIGVRRTTDLLEKLTWGSATAIMVLAIVANTLIIPETSTSNPEGLSPNIQEAQSAAPLLEEGDDNALLLPPADSLTTTAPPPDSTQTEDTADDLPELN